MHRATEDQALGAEPDGNKIFREPQSGRRWCIFTSAGDRNAIDLWLTGGTTRRWNLVVAYYGDNDKVFSDIANASSCAFRAKGGKFQILKKFVDQNPHFFDQYSYIWVCDDDIQMSSAQIDEAFAITEFFEFWIAQPAFSARGKISHEITSYAGSHCDYRTVNFIELGVPIFCREKLMQFLTVYDGGLTGYGTDYWYLNFFKANELGHLKHFFRANEPGRFAIIDRVQVINPHDEEKGSREIDQLKPLAERRAEWVDAMVNHGLVEFRHKVFASYKIDSRSKAGGALSSHHVARRIAGSPARELARNVLNWLLFCLQKIRGQGQKHIARLDWRPDEAGNPPARSDTG